MSTVLLSSGALTSLVHDCFERLGVPAPDAAAVAEVLVDADLRGNESHGVARAPTYMRRVAEGVAGGTERMSVVERSGPLCRVDAGSALGPAAAVRATDLAAQLALEHGLGLVAVGNSSHFGAAGYYARRASGRGLAAVVVTNGPATMAPHGSAEPFLGTNALAIAVPGGEGDGFAFDMSCSVSARGRIIRARRLGEEIEPGLAIDAEGNPTTDPAAALEGAALPVGGAKGTGLALAISLLVGVLGGAAFDHEVVPMHGAEVRAQNLGHLFLLVDPGRLGDRDEAAARVELLLDMLRSLRPAPGADRVHVPGEQGAERARSRLREGIPLPTGELEALASACEELGLDDLGGRARALAVNGSAR